MRQQKISDPRCHCEKCECTLCAQCDMNKCDCCWTKCRHYAARSIFGDKLFKKF